MLCEIDDIYIYMRHLIELQYLKVANKNVWDETEDEQKAINLIIKRKHNKLLWTIWVSSDRLNIPVLKEIKLK